jgi:galactofuranose transport system permease protein
MNTWHKLKWPLIALALVLLFNAFFTTGFFNLEIKSGRLFGSLVDILNRAAPMMLVSLGMTLVIATGGVDLSVGSVMAIAGTVGALLLSKAFSVPAVILLSLGTALVFGIWNGILVGVFKITPIVATLILMVSGRGIAQLLSSGQHVRFDSPKFEFIGRGTFLGLPFTVTLVLVAFAILHLLSTRTALGLFVEATGDNERASRYAGINTDLMKLAVYSICGLLAGVAGLIVVTDVGEADPSNAGMLLELDAILATVIGGTSLLGGRFYLLGSLIGAILIQTLTTTILTRGVGVEWTQVVKAIVIIAVCLLQSEQFRKTVFARWRRSAI